MTKATLTRWLMWYRAVHAMALTPAGRREREILARPDVQAGVRESMAEIDRLRRAA